LGNEKVYHIKKEKSMVSSAGVKNKKIAFLCEFLIKKLIYLFAFFNYRMGNAKLTLFAV